MLVKSNFKDYSKIFNVTDVNNKFNIDNED